MGIVVDLIVVLIFILCIFTGYKRGLAKCLLKIVTSILAIIMAFILYKPFVNFLMQSTTIDDNIELSIEKIINQNTANESNNKEIVSEDSNLPKPVIKYINSSIQSKVNEEKSIAVKEVSKSATVLIINITCGIIIYIISKILLKILTILIDVVSKLPVIKQCNELGGILYGILEALVIILIILTLIAVITPLIGNLGITNIIMQSYITKFIYSNNILLNIIF